MTCQTGVATASTHSYPVPSSIYLCCISVSCNTISLDWRTGDCGCDEYTYFYIYDGSSVVGGTSASCYTVVGLCPCSYHNLYVVGIKRCQGNAVYSNMLTVQTQGSQPVYPDCGPHYPTPSQPQPNANPSTFSPNDTVILNARPNNQGGRCYPAAPCMPQSNANPSTFSPYDTVFSNARPNNQGGCCYPAAPCMPQPNANPSTFSPYDTVFSNARPNNQGGCCYPAAPCDLKAEVQQSVSVNLRWHGNNGNARNTCFHVYKDCAEVAVTYDNFCQICDLCPGRQYNFYVYAQDRYGNWSPCSNVVTVPTNGYPCC